MTEIPTPVLIIATLLLLGILAVLALVIAVAWASVTTADLDEDLDPSWWTDA